MIDRHSPSATRSSGMGGTESIFGSEEPEQPGPPAPEPAQPPPPHPALAELARRGIAAAEGRLPQGARGVSLGLASAAAEGASGEPAPREGILSPVDCCVLSLAMPLAPAAALSEEPTPPAPAPPQPSAAVAGPPSDPDEMRLWLQAQMGASAAAPEPEPEPQQPALSEAVPPAATVPSVADIWQQLYDSHHAGTAIHTFGRGVSGYDGPSLLVLRVRPTAAFAGAPPAKAGLIGAFVDTPWRTGEHFFGGNTSFLFGMAERDAVAFDEEHCRVFPVVSTGKSAPGNVAFLCTEPRRGGPPRGVGFGGVKKPPNGSRLWIEGDLCRGKVSLDPRVCSTFAPGDMFWWSETQAAGLSRDFEILQIQAFGCANDGAAFEKRDAALRHKDATAARAGKVDARNFVDGETGGLDSGTRALLSGGAFGVKDQADLSKQQLESER